MDSERKELSVFWFVENYSYCWHENGEALTSPRFSADGLEGTAWNLYLYPRGYDDDDEGYISVYIKRRKQDKGPESISVRYELSALGLDGLPLRSVESDETVKKGKGFGDKNFLARGDVLLKEKYYLPQDTLTVRCRIWIGVGEVRKVPPICARSRIGIEKISFLQVVENFSTLQPHQKNTIQIRSPLNDECFASSCLHFSHESWREGEMIVEIKPYDSRHVLAKRKISLLGTSGNVIGCGGSDIQHDDVRNDIQKLPLSLTRQSILDREEECLPEGKLSLLCECTFSTGLEFEKMEGSRHGKSRAVLKRKYKKISTSASVSEDMKSLYLNQRFTDMELKTETKSFQAHKIVLCARSPVFNSILTSDMSEKQSNCIRIDDLGDDVVQQMLLFLYSDSVQNLDWKMATRLYYAADKYQVGKLRDFCSSFLLANLYPSKAPGLLILSDTHADTRLKRSVEDFLQEHEEQVFGSEKWEKLMKTHPLLVAQAMQSKYKRRKVK